MELSPERLFGLAGRRALVTGSGRGIGAAIARGLAAAGARVCAHARTRAGAAHTCERIAGAGGRADALAAELSIPGAGRALAEAAAARMGGIDILVINASAQRNAPLDALTAEDLERQTSVNLRATVELLQACLPPMAERGWGRVVGIGSVNQYAPKPWVAAYAATKAAQHNLIRSQAQAYAGTGVVLNTLAPGLVDTDRNAARKADAAAWREYVAAANWMGRIAAPEEMVGAALFLASDACGFMTGECVPVTGGV